MRQLDAAAVADVLKRLRRAEGRLGGVLGMLEQGRDCFDVLPPLAAVSRALDRAGFKLISSSLHQCLQARAGAGGSTLDEQRLERLFLSLA